MMANKNNAQDLYIKGSKQYFAKQFDEALDTLSEAFKIDPQHFEAFDRRGSAYKQLSQLDRALNDFNQALAINPKFHRAYRNRGHILRDLNLPLAALTDFEASRKYSDDTKRQASLDIYIQEIKNTLDDEE